MADKVIQEINEILNEYVDNRKHKSSVVGDMARGALTAGRCYRWTDLAH